jgi:5-aminolevulinate synthase
LHEWAVQQRRRLDTAQIPHRDNPSHIVPAIVGDPVSCRQISYRPLEEFSIYVQPINYPTVPRGTERLRVTPSLLHSGAEIDHLVTALRVIWSGRDLRRAA